MIKSSFNILEHTDNYVLISDNALIKETMSITNDAENVVEHLHKQLNLKNKDLYYIDTDGRVDLLVHDNNGKFINFKAGYDSIDEFSKQIKIK